MLGDHPVDVMLLATDLGVARRFFGGVLGLEGVAPRRAVPHLPMWRRQPLGRH